MEEKGRKEKIGIMVFNDFKDLKDTKDSCIRYLSCVLSFFKGGAGVVCSLTKDKFAWLTLNIGKIPRLFRENPLPLLFFICFFAT
ncbi:MAG: hypothetical protein KHX42_08145 [Prevotella sp.]|nr:hypothetical protein [Prevotella sp.]